QDSVALTREPYALWRLELRLAETRLYDRIGSVAELGEAGAEVSERRDGHVSPHDLKLERERIQRGVVCAKLAHGAGRDAIADGGRDVAHLQSIALHGSLVSFHRLRLRLDCDGIFRHRFEYIGRALNFGCLLGGLGGALLRHAGPPTASARRGTWPGRARQLDGSLRDQGVFGAIAT